MFLDFISTLFILCVTLFYHSVMLSNNLCDASFPFHPSLPYTLLLITIYLYTYSSIYLSIHLSISLSIYLSLHIFAYLSIYISIYLPIQINMSNSLSMILSIYLLIYLSYFCSKINVLMVSQKYVKEKRRSRARPS